jgi:hypothetical protein
MPSARRILIFGAAPLLFLVLALYAAGCGPTREYDDFWHLTDLRTLINNGPSAQATFPMVLQVHPSQHWPLLHNLPVTQALRLPARLFGPYKAWILANLFFILVAWLLLLTMIYCAGGGEPSLLVASALFLPSAAIIHVAAHPLPEAAVICSLMATCAAWLLCPASFVSGLATGFLAGVTALNRPTYLLFAAILWFRPRNDQTSTRWIWRVAYVISLSAVYLIGRHFMPQADLGVVAGMFAPANHGMEHFYRPVSHSAGVYLARLADSFRCLLIGRNLRQLPLTLLFNLLLLRSLFFRPRDLTPIMRDARFLVWANIAVYLATVVLFRYQTRFLVALLPLLALDCALTFPLSDRKNLLRTGIALWVAANLTGSILYAISNRNDARFADNALRAYHRVELRNSPPDVILSEGDMMLTPWAFPEHPMLIADNLLSTTELLRLHETIRYNVILCDAASPIPDRLGSLHPVLIGALPEPLGSVRLYRIPDPENP